MSGLTAVNVLSNQLDSDSASMLLKIKAEKPNLRTLCGLSHEETELDYRAKRLGPADAMLLAPELGVMSGLTSVSYGPKPLLFKRETSPTANW